MYAQNVPQSEFSIGSTAISVNCISKWQHKLIKYGLTSSYITLFVLMKLFLFFLLLFFLSLRR